MNQCLDSNTIGTNAVFNYCLTNNIKLIYSATSAFLAIVEKIKIFLLMHFQNLKI